MDHKDLIIRRVWWKSLLPVPVRQNAGLIFGSAILLILTVLFLGAFQIRPIVFSSDGPLELSDVIQNVDGQVDLFDKSIPHSIELLVSDIEYQQMIYDFQVLGEKSWIQADAIIDDVLVPSVGIRLKGNSTLMGLAPGGAPGMEALTGNASFDNPSTLPLLLSFNEYYEGRAYQGRLELAVRPAQEDGTGLNEALAIQLIEDSGQLIQNYTWTEFRVNDAPSATRVILENPDQQYALSLGLGRGVLYKSRSANVFAYKGEDTTEYVEDFTQLNAIGSRDISPIINFLEWLENSSDEEFDAGLADWINVPSFARYVATHKILENFDDMAGPGRNFLLWYGLDEEKFTVITWDMNLALVGNLFAQMMEGMMGAMMGGDAGMPPPPGVDIAAMMEVMNTKGMPDVKLLSSVASGAGFELMWGNILKDRFVASEAFANEIANAEAELAARWTSEYALQLINQLTPSIPVSDGLSEEQIAHDIEVLKNHVNVML